MTSTAVRPIALHRVLAAVEAVLATVSCGLAAFFAIGAIREARWAEQTYGHNVDSGAIAWMAAITLFAPAGVLLAVGALSLWRQWAIRWWVQGVVVVGLVGLVWAM